MSCYKFEQTGECQFGDSCRFMHGGQVNPNAQPRQFRSNQCRQFEQNGNCSFGDRCRFAHGNDGKVARNFNRGPYVPRSNGPRQSCYAFNESGQCKFGDSCKFQHGEGDTRENIGMRKQGVCHSFRDNGECQYGDGCRFSHGQQ